jgi:SAM-dependent methyltransferase
MTVDFGADVARYYDYDPTDQGDIELYQSLIPSRESTVLELGCGTGRVLIPLVNRCSYIHGIDVSEAMLAVCRKKLHALGVSKKLAIVQTGDITDLNLGRFFDLITAPLNVFQNLETNEEVDGFFETVRTHIAPSGTCIISAFRPPHGKEVPADKWLFEEEKLMWETEVEGGHVACFDRRPSIDLEKQIIYPDQIFRRYRGEKLEEEAILNLLMRYYYPDEFVEMIESHGFQVMDRWGGYHAEAYGEGQNLVVQFCK